RAAHAPGSDEPSDPDERHGPDGVGGAAGTGGVFGSGWSGGYLGDTLVGGEAVRRLACDAGLHRLVVSGRSTLLDYGRQTRSISDSLFDVLTVRDGGCRWPGCEVPAWFCDGHHALHWADLGETEPDNLALLCWHHHHLVHEDGWCIEPLGAGNFRLHTPAGLMVPMSPSRLVLTDCA
ncbi:MAG: HNH endonuclease signature motif containing protein, partial [Ilumatobacteraceae bacterium]